MHNNSEITKVNNNSEITIIEPPLFSFFFVFVPIPFVYAHHYFFSDEKMMNEGGGRGKKIVNH